MTQDDLLTARQVAEMLGIKELTVKRMAYAHKIASIKLGNLRRSPLRFRRSEVERYIAEHTRPAQTRQAEPPAGDLTEVG